MRARYVPRANWPGVIEQRIQAVPPKGNVGSQRVLAKKLIEKLTYRALRKATPPPWPGVCQE